MGRTARWLGLLVAVALAVAGSRWFATRRAPTPPPPAAARVILFAPNLTETAFALGAGDRVVAVTDWCVWPPEALDRPQVGGMIDPNLERIAALDPDLFVLQGENPDLRSFASDRGLQVASVKMDDGLDSILTGIAEIDGLLHGDDTAASDRLVTSIRDALEAQRRPVESGPRTLLVLSRTPGTLEGVYVVGPGTFLADLLDLVGARPAIPDATAPYFQLSLETLVASPPEVVVELRPGEDLDDAARDALRKDWVRPGLESARIGFVTFDGAMIPGPRVVETARHLADAIHGEAAP